MACGVQRIQGISNSGSAAAPRRKIYFYTRGKAKPRFLSHSKPLASGPLSPSPFPLFAFRTVPRDSAKMHRDRRSSLPRYLRLDNGKSSYILNLPRFAILASRLRVTEDGQTNGRREEGRANDDSRIPRSFDNARRPYLLPSFSDRFPRTKAVSVPPPLPPPQSTSAMSFRQA